MDKLKLPIAIILGISSAYLLRDMYYGLNYLLFFTALISTHLFFLGLGTGKKNLFKLALVVSSMVSIILYGKGWSVFLLFITYLALVADTHPRLHGFFTDLVSGVSSSFKGLPHLLSSGISGKSRSNSRITRFYYIAIPSLVVFIFAAFYSTGSSYLAVFLGDFFQVIADAFEAIFGVFDFQWFVLFSLGVLLTSSAVHHFAPSSALQRLIKRPNTLLRPSRIKVLNQKKSLPKVFNTNAIALKVEYKLACIILVCLNVLLFVTNGLDVWNLWFQFNPSGIRLSQFVHEGTYVLIFSIILASLVLLFYYRGNLNFYKNNKRLFLLAQIWILQNAVLATSVAVRNYHYVNYTHALTEKRIGVFVFLILVILGLAMLYLKIRDKKSITWLVKTNLVLFMGVLSVVQMVNWERVIITYNFSNPLVKEIDVALLFKEVDYDLVFLDQKIAATKGELEKYSGRSYEDVYSAWDRRKAYYQKRFTDAEWHSWNYHQWKNLKNLHTSDVSLLERNITH
ncbi:MAG: DUF4173 domain-containing protein [Flavobacteriales bacterium]